MSLSIADASRRRDFLTRRFASAIKPTLVLTHSGQSQMIGNSGTTDVGNVVAHDPIRDLTVMRSNPATNFDLVPLTHAASGSGGDHLHGAASPAHGVVQRSRQILGSDWRIASYMLAWSGSQALFATTAGTKFHWDVRNNPQTNLILSTDPALADGNRNLRLPQLDGAIARAPHLREDWRVHFHWQGTAEVGQVGVTAGVTVAEITASITALFDYLAANHGVDLFVLMLEGRRGDDQLEVDGNAAQVALIRQAQQAVADARADTIVGWSGGTQVGSPFNTFTQNGGGVWLSGTEYEDATHPTGEMALAVGRYAAEKALEALGLYTPPAPVETLRFGALTPVGAGAAPIAGVADGTYGQFTVAGGQVTPNVSPLTVGTVSVGGASVEVLANARHVSTEAQLQAALHGAGKAASGQTVYIRNKGSIYAMKALPWASTWDEHPSGVTWEGDDPDDRPEVDYWDLRRTVISDPVFRHIKFRMTDYPARGPIDAALSAATWAMIATDGAPGLTGLVIEDCAFDGGLLPFAEGGRFVAQNPPLYVRGNTITDFTFRRNLVENVSEALMIAIAGFTVEDNIFRRYHNDGIVLQNASTSDCDAGVIRNNHFQEQVGWGGLFHSDLIQFQPINAATRIGDIEIAGNTSSIAASPKPAQTDAVSHPGGVTYTSARTFDSTDHARTITLNGTFTATLPSAAANAGRQFCVKCTGGTVTIAPTGGDTWEGGAFPVLTNGGYASFVSDGSTQWKQLPPGLWSQHIPIAASRTLGANEANRVVVVDASAGNVTVTLPDNGGQTYTIFRADYSANTVTIVRDASDTLNLRGAPVATIPLVPGAGCTIVGSGSGTWTATESTPTAQGLFGNAHPQGLYDDVRVHGNILYVVTTHGIHLEQDVAGLRSWNNTILRPAWDDANGDGVLGAFEAETGTGYGGVWTNGTDSWSFRDLAVGPLNAGTSHGSVFLNAASTTAALAALGPYLDGTARANQRPVTRAEVIAAATGAAASSYLGAVGYWNFATGAPASGLPAPVLLSAVPATGADLDPASPVTLTFDHFLDAGTGNLVLRNVTDATTIETFNIATGTGDNGGTVAISGRVVTVDPGAALPAGKTVSLRIDGTALVSATWGIPVPAVTNDSISWPVVAAPAVVPTFVLAQGQQAFNNGKTWASVVLPAGRAILMLAWRSSTNHAAPTVTIGGNAATLYGSVYVQGQLHIAVFERVVTAGTYSIVSTFGAQQYDQELAVYGVGDATIQASYDYNGPSSPTPLRVEHTAAITQGQGAIGMAYTQVSRGADAFSIVSGWGQIDAQPTSDADFTIYMSGAALSAGNLPANAATVFRVDWNGAHQTRIGRMVVVG